jgi:hypothetical protein
MKEWVERAVNAGQHRGGDRRLRLLGRHSGGAAEPDRLHRAAVPQAGEGRFPRAGLRLQGRPPGDQHPRLPGPPRLDHADPGGPGHRPHRRHRPRRPAPAPDVLQDLHPDGLHPGAVLRVQAVDDDLRRRDPDRLPLLRVRLPWADDPLAVQPDPVEPSEFKTRAGMPCLGCTEPEFPFMDLAPGTVFKTTRSTGSSPKRCRRNRSPHLHGTRRRSGKVAAPEWSKKTCSSSETDRPHEKERTHSLPMYH